MANDVSCDLEFDGVLRGSQALVDRLERRLKEAAKLTAERIRDEAKRRVARATGQTADDIVVVESKDGRGYLVIVAVQGTEERRDRPGKYRGPNLDIGLEFGTKHTRPQPFLHNAKRLEASAHERRVREILRDVIQEVGFGG
jgi:hypothetical protein